MISSAPDEAYVWVYLPGATEPVVAGRIYRDGQKFWFNYGQSYLARSDAIPIYQPELPLRAGAQPPSPNLSIANALRDAAPDAWGRRVILNRILGLKGKGADVDRLDELTYLLESGSDRTGALDFQRESSRYNPRGSAPATLEELANAAQRIEEGAPVTPELEQALFHGSSVGGARPKALVEDEDRRLIAKFSSSSDIYNVVKGEFLAMRLAGLAGLKVAPVALTRAGGRDVLLVERFDRVRVDQGWSRKAMVSALTLLNLDEMMARYASYEDLATVVRQRFAGHGEALRELFGRLVFNILCGNTDDHARNHAAFWDGRRLELTPAYDICPQGRAGNVAAQAMLILGSNRMSQLAVCLEAAPLFQLTRTEAEKVIKAQLTVVRENWDLVCDEAGLALSERTFFWRRQFLNPFVFEGLEGAIARENRD